MSKPVIFIFNLCTVLSQKNAIIDLRIADNIVKKGQFFVQKNFVTKEIKNPFAGDLKRVYTPPWCVAHPI